MTTSEIKEPLLLTIAVLGGTGKEGKGLAYRWAKAGYKVLIGSRSSERAVTAASEIVEMLDGSASAVGAFNQEAAQLADIVVLTVPYAAHRDTLESVKDVLAGKILIDVTVPLVPPKVSKVQMPAAGSAAQEAKDIVGEGVEVVAAFQNISHEHLLKDEDVECDVLVAGTSKAARVEALKLVEAAGLTGWDAGPIENSVVLEGLTSVLININKQYGSTHAGIKITGATNKR
ncbi:MAG: NADPH-dependent F420 reductase [Anaerolineales bacterium]|nr:NADPH-dependent F420 reductase [Anaerolineales bacterium]